MPSVGSQATRLLPRSLPNLPLAEDIARDLLVGLHTVQMLTDYSFVSQLMQSYSTCPDFQVLYQLGNWLTCFCAFVDFPLDVLLIGLNSG